MKNDFTAKIISFDEVYKISHKLSLQITAYAASFDMIIGIARGGVIPARLLCDFLNIDHLTTIQVRHYSSGAEELEKASIPDSIDQDLKGKNVLLVDDVNDSGKTFEAAVNHIQGYKPSLLKTAALHEKETTVFNTDFIAKKLKKWEWLIYQWAVTEDLLEFLHKDDMLDESVEKAVIHLSERYDLEVDKELLHKVIKLKENYF